MNGFEFVLLAIRGRLAEEGIAPAERERLEGFLADYWRIAEAYHARQEAAPRAGLVIDGVVQAEIVPSMAN